jgi:hypothetical protein
LIYRCPITWDQIPVNPKRRYGVGAVHPPS